MLVAPTKAAGALDAVSDNGVSSWRRRRRRGSFGAESREGRRRDFDAAQEDAALAHLQDCLSWRVARGRDW